MNSNYLILLFSGLAVTLATAICALILGLAMGTLGALGESARHSSVRYVFVTYHTIVRGVPEILVIFFVYFGSAQLLNSFFHNTININPFIAGSIALGLLFGAYASQTIRGAFLVIKQGQIEAAQALALSKYQTFWRIKLPQACRYALPGLGNLWLVLLKDTALVSLIGLADLMMNTQAAAVTTQKPFTFYMTAAVIYLGLTSISEALLFLLNKNNKVAPRRALGI